MHGVSIARHAYPHDLAAFAVERWPSDPPPDAVVLDRLCAVCYHASMQRDEDRAITCRVLFAPPTTFPDDGGPPDELHCLRFEHPRSFTVRELRRLSAAANTARTLIGVCVSKDGALEIWGLVYQGSRWTHDFIGGRGGGPELPDVPVLHAMSAGALEIRCGTELVGRLERGAISESRYDVFESTWLHQDFRALQDDLNQCHAEARRRARERGERWAEPEPTLARLIGEQMMKRAISVARWQQRHGGMLVFLPGDGTPSDTAAVDLLDIKYPFTQSGARRRFFDLVAATLDRLGALHGELGRDVVTWDDVRESSDEQLEALDEGLFGLANLLANLTAVDGAVVLDKHLEILGFGAEISGELPSVPIVDRALDPEGNAVVPEQSEHEGTRHRSAYRLVAALPGALVIVISQDGGVRFVTQHNGRVTYWTHE